MELVLNISSPVMLSRGSERGRWHKGSVGGGGGGGGVLVEAIVVVGTV